MKNGRFTHGGDVFAAARDLGLSWRKVLDYSANVNPLGPPPGLKKKLMDCFGLVEHYPDPFAWGWRQELADRYGLSPQEVMAGNGTTSLMYLLARTLRPKRAVIVAPAFAEYEVSLVQAGASVQRVDCRSRDEFDLTPKTLGRVFDSGPDLVFLANPSSPAGRLAETELLDRSLYLSQKAGAVLVVDEAFLDFTDAGSLLSAVRKHNNLIVLRSLTKFYALPGLRLGFLAAGAGLVKRLFTGYEPWSVNALALAAGSYCLDQEEYARRTRRLIARERAWLSDQINHLGLGRVIPGAANYLLIKIEETGLTVVKLVLAMRAEGILIRDCRTFKGLGQGFIRVAVKTRRPNERLIQGLKKFLSR